jgi:hypothetical protein
VDGAREVREPEAVRGAGADRRWRREGPPGRRRLVPPRVARVLQTAPRGALPLGLGGEPMRLAGLTGEPTQSAGSAARLSVASSTARSYSPR